VQIVGYVLSKEALIRFITTGLADTTGAICNSGKESKEHEDYEMGSCLQASRKVDIYKHTI
jgi:hypothetical protein